MQRLYILQYFHRYSLVYNIHISVLSAILQRYTFYTVRWGRSDTVAWKWPGHGKIELRQHLQTSLLSLIWVKMAQRRHFRNNFFRGLALAYLWNVHRYHHFKEIGYRLCISMPPGWIPQSRDNTWASQSYASIASILRQILLSMFPMQKLFHIFSYSRDAI